MTDFPVSVPVFTTLADDVDDVLAAHQNTPNDEITAIATLIGALGISQSKSNNLLTGLDAMFPTMRLSYTDAATVTASVGQVWTRNAAIGSIASQRGLRRNTSTTAITGANLDTGSGSFAVSTSYFVYANGDAVATTATFKVSTSGTSPTGVTLYGLIGGFATDSSGNVISSTVWSVAGMTVLQAQISAYTALATITATTPIDDTVPDISEGTEITTLDFFPRSTTSKILILGFAMGSGFTGAITQHLHRDAIAAALRATINRGNSSDQNNTFLGHFMTSPGQAKTTFRMRLGLGSAGTFYVNGLSAARLYGGVAGTFLLAIEFESA